MKITELVVGSKEQSVALSDGFTADIKFDVFTSAGIMICMKTVHLGLRALR